MSEQEVLDKLKRLYARPQWTQEDRNEIARLQTLRFECKLARQN